MKSEITEYDPPRKLSFTWGSTGGVTFELEPRGDKVGRPSLDGAPKVELQARPPTDHARAIVDFHRAPLGNRVGASRAPWRR